MKYSEIASFAGLAGIRIDGDHLRELKSNTAFQRLEQALFDKLNQLYDAIVMGGLTDKQTEYLRGQITAIRFLLGLPEMMQDEVKSFADQPASPTEDDLAEMDTFIQRRYHEPTGE